MARDNIMHITSDQTWTRQLPWNEKFFTKTEDHFLDALELLVRGKTTLAVVQEFQSCRAVDFIGRLAEKWKHGADMCDTIEKTCQFLSAVIKLLRCVHGRSRAYGGDLRNLYVLNLKCCHGIEVVAYFKDFDGEIYALLLGDAEKLQDPVLSEADRLRQQNSN